MTIAVHLPSGIEYVITGFCYTRHEDNSLWIAVSYLDGQETKTNEFPVNEETGDILHPEFELK